MYGCRLEVDDSPLDVDAMPDISLDVDAMTGISLAADAMADISLDGDGMIVDVDDRIFPEVHGKSTSYIAFGLLGDDVLLLPLRLSPLLFILSLTLFILMAIDGC